MFVISDVGMTFIVYPAALLSFPVPSLWSTLFFLMLVTMGLGTTFCTIETIITAFIDEHPALKKKRVAMLVVVCVASFLLGLPLTAQVLELWKQGGWMKGLCWLFIDVL